MISTIKLITIVLSIVALIGLPIFVYIKVRKDANVMKGILAGLAVYVFTVITSNILVLVTGDPKTYSDPMLSLTISGLLVAIGFVLGSYGILFYLKKDTHLVGKIVPIIVLGFTLFIISDAIFTLINRLMLGMSINAGTLMESVDATVTVDQAHNAREIMVNETALFYVNFFVSRVLEFITFSGVLILIAKSVIEKYSLPKMLLTGVVGVLLVVVVYLAPAPLYVLQMPEILHMMIRGLICAGCIYVIMRKKPEVLDII